MNAHLGIDIGGTWIKFGVIDPLGHVLFSDRTATRATELHPATCEVIVDCARRLVDWCTKAGYTPASVGVGSPGTIHPVTKIVQPPTPNLTSIIGVNLAELVQTAIGLPTAIDNDANCAAWAENRFGAGRGIDNLICVTVGSGIGSGFIVDGKIFPGSHGSGGELGHVTIDKNGPHCPCGNRGCLELYASANAMSNAAGGMTIAELFQGARDGDSRLTTILNTSAEHLAIGILNAVQLFDPEAVLIGGGAADADTDGRWLSAIADGIHRHAFSAEGKSLPIRRAALGNDAGFIGAADLGARLVAKTD